MSINIRGRIYTNRLMNIYREFHVATLKQLYTHEINIKNSGSNFTPTEDEFLIKDSM